MGIVSENREIEISKFELENMIVERNGVSAVITVWLSF